MMVSAPLQNNMTRSSGVRTKDEQIRQDNHIGLLSGNLPGFTEGSEGLFPVTLISAVFGG